MSSSQTVPLSDLRRVSTTSLPSLVNGLDPAAPLVVLAEQAALLPGRCLWVWPPPPDAQGWGKTYDETALRVLQHRLGAPGLEMYAADGSRLSAAEEPAETAPARPLLAIVSPLPPERSGISDYTAALLPALNAVYSLVLIHPDPQTIETCLDAEGVPLPLHSPNWLDECEAQDLRILYHLGNSQFHEPMLKLMLRHPGVVVLHDYYLSHLMDGWCRHGAGSKSLETVLYHGHGYRALQSYARERPSGGHGHLWSYSLNQSVLQSARGVLVHSPHSLDLARREYAAATLHHWHQVPMLSRALTVPSPQALAVVRERFGLAAEPQLICSFGYLGPAKLSLELVEAFALSGLAHQGWTLVLAGSEGGNTAYRRELEQAIEATGLQDHAVLTGWIDADVYAALQQLSSINVQLRSLSRGETSAAVMDCLQTGAALIVNRHGSLDDLPESVCRKLPDCFTPEQLVEALVDLALNTEERQALGQRAQSFCRDHHSAQVCAEAYHQAIESVYQRPGHPLDVAHALAASSDYRHLPKSERLAVINDLAARLPALPSPRRLYVDVSAIAQSDLGTGIQRVTSSICRELFSQVPPGWIVEPVQASPDLEGYRTAPAYSGALLGISPTLLPAAEPVLPNAGDLVLVLDLHHAVVKAQEAWLLHVRARGAQVWFVVYDLLPCLLPECFPPGTDQRHARWLQTVTEATGAVCISRTVAADLEEWVRSHTNPGSSKVPPQIRWFHQGSDLQAGPAVVPPFSVRRSEQGGDHKLLMVGTIEPRKGYLQVLQAMQLLWGEDFPLQLTIVGREGWKALPNDQRRNVPETIALLNDLQKRYPQRFRWLNNASDQQLLNSYREADTLLAASFGEGFGLPLVEAHRNGLAVIARDLPVFREVLADDADYFQADEPDQLADWLREWCQSTDRRANAGSPLVSLRPRSAAVGISWKESCTQLLEALSLVRPSTGTADPWQSPKK